PQSSHPTTLTGAQGSGNKVTAVIAWGKRPVPFRTRKLRPTAPMVLHPGGWGRVGHRRTHIRSRPPNPHRDGGSPTLTRQSKTLESQDDPDPNFRCPVWEPRERESPPSDFVPVRRRAFGGRVYPERRAPRPMGTTAQRGVLYQGGARGRCSEQTEPICRRYRGAVGSSP